MRYFSSLPPKAPSLIKPLVIAVGTCLLAACSTTNTQQTHQAPASIHKPAAMPPSPKPAVMPSQSVSANTDYQGVIDADTLDAMEDLLSATNMAMVEGDALTVQRYGDLWGRVRQGFRIPEVYNARIEAQKSWFYTRQSYIDRLTARSSRYLHHTITEAERRGIPTELALLPIIESSYDPTATSNASAAGLWQFIPSTGRIYGLNQSASYDGRRDVIESTRAAYDFLTSLYNQFGSWELALAAYNAGPGRVSRAIAANEAAGLPTDYWSLRLPTETMNYVPRFLAVAQIVNSPATYGINLPPIANHTHFRTVPVNYGVSLYDVAGVTGVSIEELKLLNPALTNLVVDAAGPNRIVIPDSVSSAVDMNLSALSGYAGSSSVAIAPIQTTQYVTPEHGGQVNTASEQKLMQSSTLPTTIAQVTPNNTVIQEPPLSSEEREFIAAQIQASTPQNVQAISPVDGNIELDAIQTSQSVLDARGQTKQLSYTGNTNRTQAQAPSQTKPTPIPKPSYTPPVRTVTPPKPAPKPVVQSKPKKPIERYTVKSGDTLTGIADTHNLSISQIAEYNNIATDTMVRRGQKLWLVPGKVKSKPKTATTDKPKQDETYKVQSGDNLTQIAQKFNLSLSKLAALNGLSTTDGVLIGQVLKVSGEPVESSTKSTKPATTKNHKTIKYTVKAGDTLTGVANAYGVSIDELAAANNMQNTDQLLRGATITIPADGETSTQSASKAKAVAQKPSGNVIQSTESYKVQAGDSLTSLANKYGVSIDDLATTNGLSSKAGLRRGQTLKVPKLTTIYTVRSGDNLTTLARKYGIDISDLAKMNNLSNTDQLIIGQKITVPNK
ncbi:LysM peptidoglycan-binding domain-containing protein [Moraxella nasovis]|uniref:LysM peptidoglycan-binding domain-containing protein n=1 Tax=Moraxella nasovis TaxID=2904121 RepID=UPI001F6017D5|nr:LysM peptidoglycan-binding domain-containing protein [Moraxella nasovis]UNU73222.1 LysM peptidoglycan-binding domain-containing protein [Moraxella nasovis]